MRHGIGRGHGLGSRDFEEIRFGHRHGRRRLFDQGDLRLVVLALMNEGPRHGYELIRAIEEKTGGIYAPSPGVIYPTLALLEELGLIAQSQNEGAKKQFQITEAGRAELESNAAGVDMLLQRMTALGADRADDAPVFRAMQNLKMALRGRLTRPGVGQDVMLAAAAAIDEAATRIERL